MILTHDQIIEAHKASEIIINPFDEEQVESASYDLRIGEQGGTTTDKKLVNIKENGYLLVQPGDFAIVITLEEIRMGLQHAARIGLRSKYSRKGLIATTGPQIDPGFHGRLVVGLTNLTPKPVSLPFKDSFLTIEIHKLEQPTTKPYDGPYQGKLKLGPEDIEMVTEAPGMSFSEIITTLRSLTQNVASLSTQVKTLFWVVGLAIGFLTLILAIFGIIVVVNKT